MTPRKHRHGCTLLSKPNPGKWPLRTDDRGPLTLVLAYTITAQ
jgi:hypothetical protein